jgi:hypothetical protein
MTLGSYISSLEYDLESYEHPSTYQEAEYYIKCDIRAELLRDVIASLKEIQAREEYIAVAEMEG